MPTTSVWIVTSGVHPNSIIEGVFSTSIIAEGFVIKSKLKEPNVVEWTLDERLADKMWRVYPITLQLDGTCHYGAPYEVFGTKTGVGRAFRSVRDGVTVFYARSAVNHMRALRMAEVIRQTYLKENREERS